tara:strand:+ start:498 stop:602 length:105 start_codon:yes stop_codon:yes gene_type:complete
MVTSGLFGKIEGRVREGDPFIALRNFALLELTTT